MQRANPVSRRVQFARPVNILILSICMVVVGLALVTIGARGVASRSVGTPALLAVQQPSESIVPTSTTVVTTSSTTSSSVPRTTSTTTHATTTVRPTAVAPRPAAAAPTTARSCRNVVATPEVRPSNTKANHTKASKVPDFSGNWGSNPAADQVLAKVKGDFAGTTDEIIQWAACKWGLSADVVRAQAFVESTWDQQAVAGKRDDPAVCPTGLQPPCPTAFGLMQLRSISQPGTYPLSVTSTAFNVDYALAFQRACLDGVSWIGAQTKGDVWGCIGLYKSGKWHDADAETYIGKVKDAVATHSWRKVKDVKAR
jgi:hypothetical protein